MRSGVPISWAPKRRGDSARGELPTWASSPWKMTGSPAGFEFPNSP
uniref:Uncharacterized protein n=1 Tax=Setaria italica TaxID=4555 RepID=K3Z1J6_SETIT